MNYLGFFLIRHKYFSIILFFLILSLIIVFNIIKNMKFIVLVCLALLVTANDYELLSELSQYEFGKTIIATMQISLSSEE